MIYKYIAKFEYKEFPFEKRTSIIESTKELNFNSVKLEYSDKWKDLIFLERIPDNNIEDTIAMLVSIHGIETVKKVLNSYENSH